MIRTLLANQARRHAAVLVCIGAAFLLLGTPGAEAVETPAGYKAQASAGAKAATGRTAQPGQLHAPEPVPEPRTSVLVALGLAATAFMARRRN